MTDVGDRDRTFELADGRTLAYLDLGDPDGTVVFVEVRKRSRSDFGGAGASIGRTKQQRIVFAARHYLMRWRRMPPTRFDVVLIDGGAPVWLQAAFDAA